MEIQERSIIIDISLPVSADMPIYPDNPAVQYEQRKGKTSTHTAISFGSHTGTHVDAPRHVLAEGATVDEISLATLIGPCRVIDCTQRDFGDAIQPEDIAPHALQAGERILFKTKNSERGFKKFYDDFVYLSGDAAEQLRDAGVLLVGIDAPSVKQRGGEDERPHTALLEKKIVIFENLDLVRVEAGVYTFIGLPLHLQGLDGSPARVVLVRD